MSRFEVMGIAMEKQRGGDNCGCGRAQSRRGEDGPPGAVTLGHGPPSPPSTGVARRLASLPKGVQQNPKV